MSQSIQYTIRNVTPAADARLKAEAKKQGVSLNKLVLQKLGATSQTDVQPKSYHDLDWMVGAVPSEEVDRMQAAIDDARAVAWRQAQAEYDERLS